MTPSNTKSPDQETNLGPTVTASANDTPAHSDHKPSARMLDYLETDILRGLENLSQLAEALAARQRELGLKDADYAAHCHEHFGMSSALVTELLLRHRT